MVGLRRSCAELTSGTGECARPANECTVTVIGQEIAMVTAAMLVDQMDPLLGEILEGDDPAGIENRTMPWMRQRFSAIPRGHNRHQLASFIAS
jgi:hypothetical protein